MLDDRDPRGDGGCRVRERSTARKESLKLPYSAQMKFLIFTQDLPTDMIIICLAGHFNRPDFHILNRAEPSATARHACEFERPLEA